MIGMAPAVPDSLCLRRVLPCMVAAMQRLPALTAPHGTPDAVHLPTLVQPGCVALPAEAVFGIVACQFFGVLPWRVGVTPALDDGRDFNAGTFAALLSSKHASDVAKLQCYLQYFAAVADDPALLAGRTLYYRRVSIGQAASAQAALPEAARLTHDNASGAAAHTLPSNTSSLPPIHFIHQGVIEDAQGCLQVDFANKYIGGGALGSGCVQEEIRFAISPELVPTCLIACVLDAEDALAITGSRIFSAYSGYGWDMRHAGPGQDATPVVDGKTACCVVAIDAVAFPRRAGLAAQLAQGLLLRELLKALAGFGVAGPECGVQEFPGVATGKWGCGVFNGSVVLKTVLQWLAAAHAGREMRFYSFGELPDGLPQFAQAAVEARVTVAGLYGALTSTAAALHPRGGKVSDATLLQALSAELGLATPQPARTTGHPEGAQASSEASE